MTDFLITERQLAARLRKTVRTLQRWRAAGTGPPFVSINGHIAYRESKLGPWLDLHTFSSNAEALAGAPQNAA